MTLSPADRQFLSSICPDALLGVAEQDLDQVLDDWFARDHYADNPVYTWNDNESASL
jgi:hypothetical protein